MEMALWCGEVATGPLGQEGGALHFYDRAGISAYDRGLKAPALSRQEVASALARAAAGRENGPVFQALYVQWADNLRSVYDSSTPFTLSGTNYNTLSCWGENINDVLMLSKMGTEMLVVRPENHNEWLGISPLSSLTFSYNGAQTNLKAFFAVLPALVKKELGASLALSKKMYTDLAFRCQMTLVPMDGKGVEELYIDVFSYQSMYNDPRNLILMITPDGEVVLRFDEPGHNKLGPVTNGEIRYFKLSCSDEQLCGTKVRPNKAPKVAQPFGINASATDTPTGKVLVVSIPLQQKKMGRVKSKSLGVTEGAPSDECEPCWRSLSAQSPAEGVVRRANVAAGSAMNATVKRFDGCSFEQKYDEPIVVTVVNYAAIRSMDNSNPNVFVGANDIAKADALLTEQYNRGTAQGPLDKLPMMLRKLTPEIVETCVAAGAPLAFTSGPACSLSIE